MQTIEQGMPLFKQNNLFPARVPILSGHDTQATVTASGTLTAAQVATGYVTTNSASALSLTLPTGTLLGTLMGTQKGDSFDLFIDNTGVAGSAQYNVGNAVNYAILSGTATTVTNSTTTIGTGNTGETTATGISTHVAFTTGSDTGTTAPYATAIQDMITLYNELIALPGTTITTPSALESNNLSGLGAGTFAPGVYTTASAITMTAANTITLSGAGDYVFISTGGAITFGATDVIALTNGAVAGRVFWVANNSITTGATDTIVGNLMTGSTGSIVIGSTNTLTGVRLLSQVATTLNGTATTLSVPATVGGTTTLALGVGTTLSVAAEAGVGTGFGLLTVPSGANGIARFTLMFTGRFAYCVSRTA